MIEKLDKIHWKKLENMYKLAPINSLIKCHAEIEHKKAKIFIEVDKSLYHAANAIHGSVMFKALDDSAFFSANSVVNDVFVLTTSFTTYFTRPVSEGELIGVGELVNMNKTQFIAESVIFNNGKEVGRGSGIFVKSKMRLDGIPGYAM